jgi:ATP-dependent RNA helicase RhlE
MKDWSFLSAASRGALLRLGFRRPTPVQCACLPGALSGESLLAVAPTGTGKTLVYLLPIRHSLPARRRNLVLVPTRELAYQVSQMLQALDAQARTGLILAVGGHGREAQLRALRGAWHTVVATPGRLLDAVDRIPDLLGQVRLLVLDEFDRLMDLGFEAQIAALLSRLPEPRQRQTLLFSATGETAAQDRLPLGPLRQYRVTEGKEAALAERFYLLKSNRKKGELLVEALREFPGRAIVFVANRQKANHLNGLLRLRGISSQALHGSRLQSERAHAYQGFKQGEFRALVATDLAARGLDIPEVDLIVNYDLPRTFREYIHRSGRTARRTRPGTCVSFAGPDDYLAWRNLEKGLAAPLPLHPDYAQREVWLTRARQAHAARVRQEKRTEFIRREQGLDAA